MRNWGVAVCLSALTVGGAACDADLVRVDTPRLEGNDARACAALVEALPDSVADLPRRRVQPEQAYAAAWGDPAIVLRCGVDVPSGLDEFATCQETNGVGWFVPHDQIEDQGADVVMTTIGFEQYVEVSLPGRYRPPAAAMVDLGTAVKASIREVDPCV